MPTESNEMDKQRRKSMQKSAKAIFKKAEDREKAGGITMKPVGKLH